MFKKSNCLSSSERKTPIYKTVMHDTFISLPSITVFFVLRSRAAITDGSITWENFMETSEFVAGLILYSNIDDSESTSLLRTFSSKFSSSSAGRFDRKVPNHSKAGLLTVSKYSLALPIVRSKMIPAS